MNSKIRTIAAMVAAFPLMTWAHVKWFVDFDTTRAPEPIAQVTGSLAFWGLLLFSTLVIFISSIFDRRLRSFTDRPGCQAFLDNTHDYVPLVMRWGTGLFFLVLAAFYPYILLTPELTIENPWLRFVQLVIALAAFSKRSSFISGFGILFLYSYAVQIYGTFHMLDYFVFIGTGVYLIIQSFLQKREYGPAVELLRFVLCYSFLWGAVEKFMQPDLFYQLLTHHSYLAMGLDWEFFVKACGFVELCLAWHIYTGKLAGYVSIAVFAVIVILAFIPFGLTDFIGHFLFVIPLIAILFTPRNKPLLESAAGNTAAFLLMFFVLLAFGYISYYVLHFHLHPHVHP